MLSMSPDDLKGEFARFDTDHNGKIDEGEFSKLLVALGVKLSASASLTAFTAIDVNGNGVIDFGEFAAWYQKQSS